MTSETDKHDDIDEKLSKIEANLISGRSDNITEASQSFKCLVQDYNECIPSKIFEWTKNINNDIIRAILIEKLQLQIRRVFQTAPLKLITIIPVDSTNGETDVDREYVVQLLMEAVDSLPEETIKHIMLYAVIPTMFSINKYNNEARNVVIDFGFQLIVKVPITKLDAAEVKLFTIQLIDHYIKVLEKWREENFCRWHELWIFLVRFSAKHLHTSMDLANKLLRVVEFAFRNPSYEQRLKGYECWKELIDNASLDMKHMCSNKQIKLLVTPLRAKFSKMEVVICKRFEVFLYLLEKLQTNSVLCLNEFLEFCFGVSNTNSSSKNGQGKLVPNLWLRSIQVFLAIIGDQSHISAELKRTLFERAIIDETNLDQFNQVVVCSVIESSTILKIISLKTSEKINILRSLWKALFAILAKSSKGLQEKCFLAIFNSLTALLKDYNEDVTYSSLMNAFSQLSDMGIDYCLYSGSVKLLIEHFTNFLEEGVISEETFDEFEESFMNISKEKHMFDLLTELLKKSDPSKNEGIIYCLWKNLGLATMKEYKDQSQSVVYILLWPIVHLNKCANFSDNMCSKWLEYFSQTSESDKKIVLNEINKTFKSNPLLSSNISTVISILERNDSSLEDAIVEPLLKLIASIMSLPLLSQETAEKLFPLILKCTKMVIAKENVDMDTVENICQCLQKIPDNQKNSTSLETIENLIKKVVPYNTDSNISNNLKILMNMFSGTKLQKKASRLATLLSPEVNSTPTTNVKRSIRMAQMVFEKDGATPNKEKVDALQLFGKDVETLTPLKVKGSILQNTSCGSGGGGSSSRTKRMLNSVKKSHLPDPPIVDDQTCEFVVIDTEVKLQKDLLTDHQKEKLKRRREDIPALYQDLSQSQTQSSLSTDTQSNIPTTVMNGIENEEKVTKPPEEMLSFQCEKLETPPPVEEKVIPKIEEKLKKLEGNDSNIDSSDESGTKKNRRCMPKSERELMRIQMDIVGGNSFIQNLPSKRPRRTIEKLITPKKSKKSESEMQTNEKSSSESSVNSTEKEELRATEPQKSDDITSENNQTQEENIEVKPVVLSDNTPTMGSSLDIDPITTPNRRKNKLMKPIKNFGSPASEKKADKTEKKATPNPKKKEKDVKTPKSSKKPKTPSKSEARQSEVSLESEQMHDSIGKKEVPVKKMKEKPKKNMKTSHGEKGTETSEIKSEVNQISKNEVTKPKKSPKELMKKNKEKVKTIQSQLKLANLSNLEVSSEKNKPKNAKLIFIRELTNSKNPQDTKVSPAGLKRNRDNKSKNIAYTIETPATAMKLSSLVNIDHIQASCCESSSLIDYVDKEKVTPKKKRKRNSSESENKSSSETPLPESDAKSDNIYRIKQNEDEKAVNNIDKSNDAQVNEVGLGIAEAENIDIMKEEVHNIEKKRRKSSKDTSSESSVFSPDSPSRSTRSRMNSPMSMTIDSPKQKDSQGVRTLFKDSEDIIESSQGSFIENSSISIGNLSRSRMKQSQNHQTSSEEFGTSKSGIEENIDTDCPTRDHIIEESPNKTEIPISQATTLTCESNYEAQTPVVQVETQEKQELSDSEKLLSLADTVSIPSSITEKIVQKENNPENDVTNSHCENSAEELEEKTTKPITDLSSGKDCSSFTNKIFVGILGTPQKQSDNLPGSPVSQATPTFKKELLDNTLDISPIGSQSTDSDDYMAKDILEALDAAIGENGTSKETEQVASNSRVSEDNRPSTFVLSSNGRSNKLLNMVNVESPVSTQKKSCKRKLASPGLRKTRYEKLFSLYRNQHNGDPVNKDDGVLASTENTDNILTFSREVPSPLAVPSSSILKRKLADTDDSYSPCPKRKRVNFSYPHITSTKLFIRHKDELNTHYKPMFAANLFDDDPQEDSEEEDPFADPESYGQVCSEESMDITNSLALCSNKPIEPRLINCEDNLDCLWKRLSSPVFCDKLKELLKSKNIETIGELASLNEIEINRLPFKNPKVKTVRKALFHYFQNSFSASKDKEQNMNLENSSSSSGEENEQKIQMEIGNQAQQIEENKNMETGGNDAISQPENLSSEFRTVLTKLKEKGSSLEEFGDIFIDLVDESDVISLLESVYNTNFRKFFGKPHWRYLVETIVKTGGTSELFDIISDLAENNKVFADQLEHIVQVRIDQDPLKNILKKKTLVQVCTALQDCIEEGEFTRDNVLQTCLMPLIKSPSDIRNYFNSLTIVQIHDLFIERVQPSDLSFFLDQIKDHYGNYTIAQCANKQDVLKICSKEELATSLIAKDNEIGAVKHLITHISDPNQLLELYNYIGNLLPFKSRIDSHIALLKSIPFDEKEE